jgi:cytochrome c
MVFYGRIPGKWISMNQRAFDAWCFLPEYVLRTSSGLRQICAWIGPTSGAKGLVIAVLIAAGMAYAQEQEAPRTLTPGKGVELTTARCVICHDAQHITRTKLSRGEWEFNIKNMIERGAPIAPAEIALILEYLATYYNRDTAPPPQVAAASDDPATLATRHACIACHAVDKRVVGPSFREIATKYAGDAAARDALAKKIKDGGAGVWGSTPMPPNAAVSEPDLQRLTAWILQQ